MAPLVAGIRAGACPRVPAEGIGYPVEAVPRVSRFPISSRQSGEAGAAARLLEVVEQALGSARQFGLALV